MTDDSDERTNGHGDDDIPLNISGHEEREAPGDTADGLFGSGDSNGDSGGDASTGDSPVPNDEPVTDELADVEAVDESVQEDGDESEGEDEEVAEPVEVLVDLAENGEIDPWDIDIVAVTDKFLDRLDEGDLRTSGRALFYASVLLRMKGDAMLADDEPEEPEPDPWEQAMVADEPVDGPDPFAALETEMDRRLERKRARGMPQTLDELVRDLRDAERDNWWKESREYDTSESPSGYQRGTQELDYRSGDDLRMDDEPTAADVTERVHTEDIDEIIDDVYGAVREHYEKGRVEVLYREIESAGGSRVQTFLGLLFLSHRGQVRLQQDELFGDLWIQDPGAVSASGEAVAD
jgi:segregation and condensation protein A